MRRNKIIEALENEQIKADMPEFGPGDTIIVQVKVREGSRERLHNYIDGPILIDKHLQQRGYRLDVPKNRFILTTL